MTRRVEAARVLVASDKTSDAAQLQKQLRHEFEHVSVSGDPALAVADFESCKPDVLVLAFRSIAKAHRYSLSLYRQSRMVNQHPHRTVLLCEKDEVPEAFDLCKKVIFDDYVLYWPLAQDGNRLAMSVWNAAREALALAGGPAANEVRAHAEQITAVETLLHDQLSEGHRHADAASQSLAGLEGEIARLKDDVLSKAFQATAHGIAGIAAWPQHLQKQLAPHVAGMSEFAARVRETRRTVMVVEDDEFARKLIAAALNDQDYRLIFANDGAEALVALRRTRPDLILMDINLPDTDGVSLTRTLKALPHLLDTPVLMLTGDARRETLAASMTAGAAGFVVKPFTRDALSAKLAKFLAPA